MSKLPKLLPEETDDRHSECRYLIVGPKMSIVGYVTLPYTAIIHAFSYGVGSGIYYNENLVWTYTKSFDKKVQTSGDVQGLLLREAKELESKYGSPPTQAR